jgi:glycine cleavage system H protein
LGEIKFTEDHEWIRIDGEDTATIGITDYAQEQLGDVVYVELPDVGTEVAQGEDIAVVESVKAAADVKLPASGEVTEVNETLTETPGTVNQDPDGAGWFLKIRLTNPQEIDELMDEAAYTNFTGNL